MRGKVYFYKVLAGRNIVQGVLNFLGTHKESFNYLIKNVANDYGVSENQVEVKIFNYMGEE